VRAQDSGLKQNTTLYRLRWLVPLALSLLGLIYVLGETFIQHEHDAQDQIVVMVGVILLSVIGPTISYLGFDWALRTSDRLHEAERALLEQNRQLSIIAEISRVANQSLDAELVLNETLERLLDLIEADIGAIWLRQNNRLALHASVGVDDGFLLEENIQSLDDCLIGEAAQGQLPSSLDDLDCGQKFLAGRCDCGEFAAAIGVPIRTGDEVVGVLEIASHRPRKFGEVDQELLGTVGYQIGSAIQKVRLHQELQRLNLDLEALVDERTGELLAAQDELARQAETLRELLVRVHSVEEATRARIAGDLHDGVQQLLNGALFEAQAVREGLRINPEVAERQLGQLQHVLQCIETEMRGAIYSLRPATLDTLGLVPALQECVRTFGRSSKTPCRLEIRGTPRRFDRQAELAAFRIVQEALNNVDAHAQATQSEVLVHFDHDRVRLEINDDGIGFELSKCGNGQGSQLGIIGMRERAVSVGGQFESRSQRFGGTQVVLELPLRCNEG